MSDRDLLQGSILEFSWMYSGKPQNLRIRVFLCGYSVTSVTIDHLFIHSFIHSFIHLSMALQPFVGPWPLRQFRNLFYTDGRTPWTGDQPVARPLPTHRTTQTQNKRTHKHPCLERDSNPRSQLPCERRQFIPYTARPLWPANIDDSIEY
jgi:hypothetical protein